MRRHANAKIKMMAHTRGGMPACPSRPVYKGHESAVGARANQSSPTADAGTVRVTEGPSDAVPLVVVVLALMSTHSFASAASL